MVTALTTQNDNIVPLTAYGIKLRMHRQRLITHRTMTNCSSVRYSTPTSHSFGHRATRTRVTVRRLVRTRIPNDKN